VFVGKSQGVEKNVNVQNVVFWLEQNTASLLLYLEHTLNSYPIFTVNKKCLSNRHEKQPFDMMHNVPTYL
jgi:hypothetical protein